MMLSPNFSLEEFTASQTAARLGLSNDPPLALMPALKNTAGNLEIVRAILDDKPIHIDSAYRSPAVNQAVGSKPTSQHLKGEAVDFICPAFGSIDYIIKKIIANGISFDQLIKEFVHNDGTGGWVHISFSDLSRKQILVIDSSGTRFWT